MPTMDVSVNYRSFEKHPNGLIEFTDGERPIFVVPLPIDPYGNYVLKKKGSFDIDDAKSVDWAWVCNEIHRNRMYEIAEHFNLMDVWSTVYWNCWLDTERERKRKPNALSDEVS